MKPIVRIAPSPTGELHVGTARTALFNYLFAKKEGGKFLLRIEDTDKERSKKEFEENIIEGLAWLGIKWDTQNLYRQSERKDIYSKKLKELIQKGSAYISKESGGEGKRDEVIRLRNAGQKIAFRDLIRGEIIFDTGELKDFIIAKDLETPLYHFAAVVDDIEMGVTHVIRGEDHISNTPRQILIMEALGGTRPLYAHIPLILAPDRSKLSKRHGATAIQGYKGEGYLPEAMINYLALLGWNPGGERELFGMEELAEIFDLGKIQKGGAIFNKEKLDWFNREYLRKLPSNEQLPYFKKAFVGHSIEDTKLKRAIPVLLDKYHNFNDVKKAIISGELNFLIKNPLEYKKELLITKNASPKDTVRRLKEALALFEKIKDKNYSAEDVRAEIWPYAEKEGRGEVLWPLRVSLSGEQKSPDPFTLFYIHGAKDSVASIIRAIEKLNE